MHFHVPLQLQIFPGTVSIKSTSPSQNWNDIFYCLLFFMFYSPFKSCRDQGYRWCCLLPKLSQNSHFSCYVKYALFPFPQYLLSTRIKMCNLCYFVCSTAPSILFHESNLSLLHRYYKCSPSFRFPSVFFPRSHL